MKYAKSAPNGRSCQQISASGLHATQTTLIAAAELAGATLKK
jgi:hypothetical protein